MKLDKELQSLRKAPSTYITFLCLDKRYQGYNNYGEYDATCETHVYWGELYRKERIKCSPDRPVNLEARLVPIATWWLGALE